MMNHSRFHSRNILTAVTVFFSLTLGLLSCAPPEPKLIPRQVLFGNPTRTKPQISPDGKRMAYLAPINDVLNVWVKSLGKENDKAITRDTSRGIRWYFWSRDSKLIMYLQDVNGNENWRLYAVDVETEEPKDFTPFDNVQVRIVAIDKHSPNEMLIGMNKENPEVHDVYRLDLVSGELTLVARNPGNVIAWFADAKLQVRGAVASNPEGGIDLLFREQPTASWTTLLTWDYENSFSSGPISFSKDGRSLLLIDSRNANAGRLVSFDIATKTTRVVAEDPKYDVSEYMINPDTYEIQAVAFTRARLEWTVLDETIKDDFSAISTLERGDFVIYDRDNADKTWLVGFIRDDGPVSFYAYDREKRKGTFLFDNRPELHKYRLARMEPITYQARDGLTIHGYLTYPVGRGRKDLPLVFLVHGGPWSRDMWGYNSEAQWLANRGYACLQVNYRGSDGYGKDFLNAGNGEWAGKMHDDIIDGARWAIERGIADSNRLGIYGQSFGGYAALVGATFTPDVFRCAIDVVGPSNLLTWINSIPPYWSTWKTLLYKRVGNPETEPEFLKSRSPLFKVDQIRIPLLIAQGANDPRVPASESQQIVDAVRGKGVECEYLLFPDEGHGLTKTENRLKFYATAERFLSTHLGGRFEEEIPDTTR